jgi:DNA-binding response OmpR family regulator
MAANSTLLCLHPDPAQLSLLKQNGYELVTASTGSDGLRLFMSRPVDAIVLDCQLGLLDGATVATAIKQIKPEVPVIMLVEDLELPEDALKSVDALVAKSDGPHFLLATLHSVLSLNRARHQRERKAQTPVRLRHLGKLSGGPETQQAGSAESGTDEKASPFSPKVWRSIWDGTIEF